MTYRTYRIQCQCGMFHGQLSRPEHAIRGICYCKDCRAYSSHLGVSSRSHDGYGGAEYVATLAKHIAFSGGMEQLACLSLSENGLLRWYTKCCKTPIAGTPRDWRISYVGLPATCLKADPTAFEHTFPKVQMCVNTASAKQKPPSMAFRTFFATAGLIAKIAASRTTGAYKTTPFFESPIGKPIRLVSVLSQEERERAFRDA